MKLLECAGCSALFGAIFFATEVFATLPLTPDPSFTPGTGFGLANESAGEVVLPLPDGRILAGGNFSTYNEIARPTLVRLHADGSLDESLLLPGGAGTDDESAIWNAGFQADGKIIVSGYFTTISGIDRQGIARLHPDGTLDTEWLPQFRLLSQQPGVGVSSLVQPDEHVLVWASFAVERLNADGSADTSFNVTLNGGTVAGVSLQEDGRILLAGALEAVNGVAVHNVARLHADGSVDESFAAGPFGAGPGGVNWVSGAKEMANGRILVFGPFDSVAGRSRRGLALLHSDGRLDVSARFKGERDFVWRARVLSDGSIVAHSIRGTDIAIGFDVTVFSQHRDQRGLKGGP